MGKAKIKVKVSQGSKSSGTKIAGVKLTVEPNQNASGKGLYQTKAQLITRIERGKRPKTTRLKRSR